MIIIIGIDKTINFPEFINPPRFHEDFDDNRILKDPYKPKEKRRKSYFRELN